MFLIHDDTYFETSATLPALTWSTSPPPPQFWNTSGGLFDCRASGILVVNCSFWSGTSWIVTPGWDFSNSLATWAQRALPAPWLALFHQTRVTLSFGAAKTAELEIRAAAPTRPTPVSASAFQRFIAYSLLRGLGAISVDGAPTGLIASSRRESFTPSHDRQPLSISVSIWVSIAP